MWTNGVYSYVMQGSTNISLSLCSAPRDTFRRAYCRFPEQQFSLDGRVDRTATLRVFFSQKGNGSQIKLGLIEIQQARLQMWNNVQL